MKRRLKSDHWYIRNFRDNRLPQLALRGTGIKNSVVEKRSYLNLVAYKTPILCQH